MIEPMEDDPVLYCDVCHHSVEGDCICPECKTCGMAGDPGCLENHNYLSQIWSSQQAELQAAHLKGKVEGLELACEMVCPHCKRGHAPIRVDYENGRSAWRHRGESFDRYCVATFVHRHLEARLDSLDV